MRLFSTIFIAGASANDFWVSNCQNTATYAIEMTIGLTEAYMDENHDDLKPSFTFDSTLGEYTNIIPGNSLRQNFTDPDYIYMEYDMVRPTETVDNLFVHHGRTTTFKCKYPRVVTLTDNVSLPPPTDPSIAEGNGHFAFDFEVTVSGGRNTVRITPQHGISNLSNNVDFCEISCNNCIDTTLAPIRTVHSWNQSLGLCLDNRLGTTLTTSTDSTSGVSSTLIDWRTFHFNDNQTPQTHDVRCDIHVESSSNMANVPNCDCYTNDQCNPPASWPPAIWPPSGLPATGWEESVQSFGTVHYLYFGYIDYHLAWDTCQLPTPRNAAENDFFRSLTVGKLCLGISDSPDYGYTLNEFRDQAGNLITYFNWRSGHPETDLSQRWAPADHSQTLGRYVSMGKFYSNDEWADESFGQCTVLCTYIEPL